MTQRMRNSLTLAAMAFAAATLPFSPVITMYWLIVAFWIAASARGVASWTIKPRGLRSLRRRRRGHDTPRTT
ncbi:MAG TPA: hypothetical protein VMU89_23425 [Thermomicrobiaceae bacterium]|nr:hypothetical protein [Thermomicrobiaceae bacterium]